MYSFSFKLNGNVLLYTEEPVQTVAMLTKAYHVNHNLQECYFGINYDPVFLHYLIYTFLDHWFIRFSTSCHELRPQILDHVQFLLQPVDLFSKAL